MFSMMRWVVPALLVAQISAIEVEDKANPLEKVIQLLDVLAKGIEKEGGEDKVVYKAYAAAHLKEMEKGEAIVKENKDKIGTLSSDLKEAEAFRAGKNQELVNLANKLARNEGELFGARQNRKRDRDLFEKNEATFVESIDQLTRALATLSKKAPAAAASASLLSVAQRLKNTLTHGDDFSLSTAQRETLDMFVRNVQTDSPQAPSFLQVGSSGPYGEMKSSNSGLVGTLEDLKVKVGTERKTALVTEQKQKKEFDEFSSGLETSLENDKKSLGDIKSAIAQSQEQSSQKQASLVEAQEILKVESDHMEEIEGVFRGKTQGYKIRLGKRADEAIAVHEARRILGSDVAKSYIKSQTVGTVFLQFSQEKRVVARKAIKVIKSATSPGLALLAMRSMVHVRHGTDPFAKVKSMLKSMLSKLNEKQAQESKHAAWCDKEMSSTTKNKRRKEEDVQKTKDRLASLSATLEQTIADIETATKDMNDLKEATATAHGIREKEHKHATSAIKEYKSAVALLTRGLKILQGYYNNKAGGGREVNKKEFKDRHGMGSGIIGILEIAIEDFSELYSETKQAEESAARDHKEMTDEGEIRTAVFAKDLEWKEKSKVKLEFDQTTMSNDLKSYEKELKAIDSYMAQLKASCIVKGPSYAEKKARREAELAGLKEALAAINQQN